VIFIFADFKGTLGIDSGSGVFQSGEILKYKVKWTLLRLGSITIETTLDSNYRNQDHFRISMAVQSSSYIPFIYIDEINQTLVDRADGMSKYFYARHKSGSDDIEINTSYARDFRQVFFSLKDLKQNTYKRLEIIHNVPPYLDGPSLFFFARRNVHSNKQILVPTIIDGKIEETKLDFKDSLEYIEVSAIPSPVRTKYIEGFALWEGGTSAGMSGNFKVWISDDEAAIPIQAEVKILLGSLVIELEDYTREGWIPPVLGE
jgi:hypothetical protein